MSLGLGLGLGLAQQGGGGSPAALLPLNSRLVFLGNSKDANTGTRSSSMWTAALCNGRYYMPPHSIQARGGDAIDDYLARIASVVATEPAVTVVGDSTNDHSAGRTSAQILADIDSIVTQLKAAGSKFVLCTTPAMASVTGANETARTEYNAGLVTRAAADPTNVKVADIAAVITTSDAAQSYDGTHYTAYGSWLAAGAISARLLEWIVPDDIFGTLPLTATNAFGANVNTEWDMDGTTGTVGSGITGEVFTGGNSQNAGGVTVAASKTTLGGLAAQRFDITGTSSSSTGDVRTYRSQTMTITPGDFVEAIGRAKVSHTDGTSAPTLMKGFHFQIGSLGALFSESIDASSATISWAFDLILRTRGLVLTTTSSSVAPELSFRFTSGDSPNVRFDTAGWQIRKIEREAYAVPYDQTVPGDGGTAIFGLGPSATPSSGAAGTVFSSTPGNVSGGGFYADSPVPGSITYQWKKASDNTAVGVGSGETTRSWTSTGAPAGSYYCAITWTNALGTITVNSGNVTVT